MVEVEGFKRSYPFVLQRICASTPIVDTYKKNDLDNKGSYLIYYWQNYNDFIKMLNTLGRNWPY